MLTDYHIIPALQFVHVRSFRVFFVIVSSPFYCLFGPLLHVRRNPLWPTGTADGPWASAKMQEIAMEPNGNNVCS